MARWWLIRREKRAHAHSDSHLSQAADSAIARVCARPRAHARPSRCDRPIWIFISDRRHTCDQQRRPKESTFPETSSRRTAQRADERIRMQRDSPRISRRAGPECLGENDWQGTCRGMHCRVRTRDWKCGTARTVPCRAASVRLFAITLTDKAEQSACAYTRTYTSARRLVYYLQ